MSTSAKNSDAVIGILKLNTNFPRLHGDIGNPASFDFPVRYITIKSAVPSNITIAKRLPQSLQREFISAAETLIQDNVSVIATTCGFLSTLQQQLAQLSTIPVIASALELLPLLKTLHGGEDRIGVLTFNKDNLNEIHTAGTTHSAIEGLLPTDSLRKAISDDSNTLDEQKALDNVIAACDRLLQIAPETSALLLECTNLSPYKNHIKEHTSMPVYDLVDAVNWLIHAGSTQLS